MTTDLQKAIALLNTPGVNCALCRGEQTHTSGKRGIAPMVDFLTAKTDLRHFAAADTIVGKASALLFVLAGVDAVYGKVMSRPALDTLTGGHEIHRDFLSVLPEGRVRFLEHLRWFVIYLAQPYQTRNRYGMILHELRVRRQIVARYTDLAGDDRGRRNALRVLVLGDVGDQFRFQRRLVAARRLGIRGYERVDLRLGKRGNVHLLRLKVRCHNRGNIARHELGRGRAAVYFLIRAHKRRDAARPERGDVIPLGFEVFGDICRNLGGCKRRDVRAAFKLAVRAYHGGYILRRQAGRVRSAVLFRVLMDVRDKPVRRKIRSRRAARDFFISEHEGGYPVGRELGYIHALRFQICRYVRGDFRRRECGYVRSTGKLLIGAYHRGDVLRREFRHIRAGHNLRVFCHIRQ